MGSRWARRLGSTSPQWSKAGPGCIPCSRTDACAPGHPALRAEPSRAHNEVAGIIDSGCTEPHITRAFAGRRCPAAAAARRHGVRRQRVRCSLEDGMRSQLRRAIIGVTACVVGATACADAPPVVGPETEVTSDSLRAYLVRLGFRGDMIVDQGDRFVVEGDIQFLKEALRARMRHADGLPVAPRQPAVRGDVSLQQWRSDLIVTSGFAERIVVNLTG